MAICHSDGMDRGHLQMFSTDSFKPGTSSIDMTKSLRDEIHATGPITVARYMQKVLMAPLMGYYMNKDVFGVKGDFITSPEVSQIFGELLAVWCIDQWSKMGQPPQFQIVELGPGRGTLTDDILRVFSRFTDFKGKLSVQLIELSPALQKLQYQKLCSITPETSNFYQDGLPIGSIFNSKHGFPITWQTQLSEVPEQFSIYIANEFFDALPVHKFQKTVSGWREVLVDVDDCDEKRFRFVLARNRTPATVMYTKESITEQHLEISPQGGVLVEELSNRIVQDGGVALIADYGHDSESKDTFRAFRNHKLHDPLYEPGSADLTADVDFGYLRMKAEQNGDVLTHGPIPQWKFLHNMGLELRLKKLLENCDEKIASQLKVSCDMLVNVNEMGERFKFFAIYPSVMKSLFQRFPPAGFF